MRCCPITTILYDIVTELMRKCVEENARTTLDQEEYTKKYSVLAERYKTAQTSIADTDSKLEDRMTKREKITMFIATLKARDGLLDAFGEKLWLETS